MAGFNPFEPIDLESIQVSEGVDLADLISDTNFNNMIGKTLKSEGGYVKDPYDPGGETKFGISKRAHPDVDIRSLTKDQAKEIYRKEYYEAPGVHRIAYPDVAFRVFDFGVNAGPTRSITVLQEALNNLGGKVKVTGELNDETLAELYKHGPGDVVKEFRAGAERFYKSLPHKRYLKGWLRRLNRD